MITRIYIYLIVSAVIAITSYILGYAKGKQSKEIEVIKNNNNLKRKYLNNRRNSNNKNYMNSSETLSNKLRNGKY